jgi:hypothetical protein
VNLPSAASYHGIMRHRILLAILAAALAVGCRTAAPAASPQPPSALYTEIANADAAIFGAFNAHDVPKLMSYFSEDLEFYHDKDGLEVCGNERGL